MNIRAFYSETDIEDGAEIRISEQQASDFAKGVAGDFNPIHDVGSRRFCVPGDLLFSILLNRYGVGSESHLQFAAMVDADEPLSMPATLPQPLHLNDVRGRNLLTLFTRDPVSSNPELAARLSEQYVQFSGQTFPDLLVGLMKKADVMINPERPLVIYKDMSLHMDRLDLVDPVVSLLDADLQVSGKKGLARLRFRISSNGNDVGHGEKNMLLSGLRPYDDGSMASIVDDYNKRKRRFDKG